MKLAFCLFKFFPYGGLQRDFIRILEACRIRGHEIHVYVTSWQGNIPADIHIHYIPTSGWQNHTIYTSFVANANQALKNSKFDLIIGFNKMPGLDVYYAADGCFKSKSNKRSWLYRSLPRARTYLQFEADIFKSGNRAEILMISPIQQREFEKFYATENSRMHPLSPGISTDRKASPNSDIIRRKKRKDLAISDEKTLLLLIGSSFKTKGLDRAMKSIAALPQQQKQACLLYVIGQDDSRSYKKLAKRLKIANQVQFLGGRDDIPELLLAADLLLHPAYKENTGTVLLEAACAGLPVLTVENCGYAHYISTNKCGVVVGEPYQQTDFNRALLTMLCSSEEMAQYKRNGLAFTQTANIYGLAENVADFIDKMAKQRESALRR